MEAIKRDPGVSGLITDLYRKQQEEKRAFFENCDVGEVQQETAATFAGEKRAASPNCQTTHCRTSVPPTSPA